MCILSQMKLCKGHQPPVYSYIGRARAVENVVGTGPSALVSKRV